MSQQEKHKQPSSKMGTRYGQAFTEEEAHIANEQTQLHW